MVCETHRQIPAVCAAHALIVGAVFLHRNGLAALFPENVEVPVLIFIQDPGKILPVVVNDPAVRIAEADLFGLFDRSIAALDELEAAYALADAA